MSHSDYYPPEHRMEIAARWRGGAKVVGVLGLLCCGSMFGALYFEGMTIVAALALAIFILFVWANALGIYDTYRYIRIVPYFDRTVGDINTYTAGSGLARYCLKLDETAAASGQTAISAFGFNDDLRGQTLVWHSAADGLKTVKAVLAAVEAKPDDFDDPCSGVGDDLERLAEALRLANEQGIRFCLLLLHGCTTSGHEWDVRQGTAF